MFEKLNLADAPPPRVRCLAAFLFVSRLGDNHMKVSDLV